METAALILIDMQKGMDQVDYYGGNRNNPMAEQVAATLLSRWRSLKWPVIHVKHSSIHSDSPLHASHPGFAIKDDVAPLDDELLIIKNVNSAFIGTPLQETLNRLKIKRLVFVGMTTNHCVSTTVRMAGNLGFDAMVISDATATFDRIGIDGQKHDASIVHEISLANLHVEFAQVLTSAQMLAQLPG